MSGPTFLEGELVALRPFEEDDLEFLRDAINDHRVWKSLGGQATPTNLAQERRFFETLCHNEEAVLFLVEADGDRVGAVELDPIDWRTGVAEVSYWLAPDQQGHGYAADAVRTVTGYAFDHLRMHKLTAEAFVFNEASRRLLERVGFEREGLLREEDFVDGDRVDVHRYGLLVGDWRASPSN